MTPLSGGSDHGEWTIADLPRVARLSLSFLVVFLFGVPTCLVTSTTEFPEAVATAPFINPETALLTPLTSNGNRQSNVPITRVLVIPPGSDISNLTVSAMVQSEDAGKPLRSRVYVNFKADSSTSFTGLGGGDTIPADIFDNPRPITGFVSVSNLRPGCNQITFMVAHTFDDPATLMPVDSNTSFVVWWVLNLVDGSDADAMSMTKCAGAVAPPVSDAGGD